MAKKSPPGFHTPFAEIKKLATSRVPAPAAARPTQPPRAAEAPPPRANPKPPPGPRSARDQPRPPDAPSSARAISEDALAFEQAMRGATPISAEERRRRASPLLGAPPPRRPRPPPSLRNEDADADADLADLVGSQAGLAAGVDRRLLRRLRAGDFPVDAELDLHGKSREVAERAVHVFLERARAQGYRCVLLIHGRGLNSGAVGPVLAEVVAQCLSGRAARLVLASTLAPPRHGGEGASLVLLRKNSPRPRP